MEEIAAQRQASAPQEGDSAPLGNFSQSASFSAKDLQGLLGGESGQLPQNNSELFAKFSELLAEHPDSGMALAQPQGQEGPVLLSQNGQVSSFNISGQGEDRKLEVTQMAKPAGPQAKPAANPDAKKKDTEKADQKAPEEGLSGIFEVLDEQIETVKRLAVKAGVFLATGDPQLANQIGEQAVPRKKDENSQDTQALKALSMPGPSGA